MLFFKKDLNLQHYWWEMQFDGESGVYSGEPTRRSFDPFNGNQVLFLINCYGYATGNLTLKQAHLIEENIAYRLPIGLKSERSVFNWISEQIFDDAEVPEMQ